MLRRVSGRLRLREEAVEWRLVDDEVVALDLRRSVYLALNRSASVLWPLIAEGTSRDRLVDRLAGEFALERTASERDVDAFVRDLEAQDLLEPAAE